MGSMKSLLDPKPFGCFVEYTLKPILDEVREILELCDKDYKSLKQAFFISVALFIFERLLSGVITLLCTGALCWTIYHILLHSPSILK